jgi:hypothetical protein
MGGQAPNTKQPPCLGFCEQVILRCVGRANLEPLAERWKSHMVALAELAKKLTVQYNIETIITPIDVQISEAIMNFQEDSTNISERVYAACGEASPSNNGLQPSLLNVAPMRTPVHGPLGKREAATAPRGPPATTTKDSEGPLAATRQHNQQQQNEQQWSRVSNKRHLSQSAGLRHSIAPASGGGFEHVPPPRVLSPASSANRLIGGERKPGPSGMHGQSSGGPIAMFNPYDDAHGSPLIQSNRQSPIIIGEIRDYLLSIKNFWSSLPNSVCNITLGLNLANNNNNNNNNPRRPTQNCFHETLEVYDMNSDLRYRLEIQHQIQRLDSMNAKISDALHGVEIDWSKSSEANSTPGMAIDPHQAMSNKPSQGANIGQRVPSAPLQPSTSKTDPSEELEDGDDPESGSGDSDIGESDVPDDEYPSTPDEEEPDEEEEFRETTTEPGDDFSPSTQTTDPPAENPGSNGNSIEHDISLTPALDKPNELITAASGASRSGALIVIDVPSLLLFSIIYCVLSVFIQKQFWSLTSPPASSG